MPLLVVLDKRSIKGEDTHLKAFALDSPTICFFFGQGQYPNKSFEIRCRIRGREPFRYSFGRIFIR